MAYKIKKSDDRGKTALKWLESYHSFSFGDYYDPQSMNFESLRVINDDIVMAGRGFATHPHRDMEIISFVFSGTLEHKDSMGNGSQIHAGGVQYMSAGTGVYHSEYNPSAVESVRLLQVWIQPDRSGYEPRYDQIQLSREDKLNRWFYAVSSEKRNGRIKIRQDADVLLSTLERNKKLDYATSRGRSFWLQVVSGKIDVLGNSLESGDAIYGQSELQIEAVEEAELMLFDLSQLTA